MNVTVIGTGYVGLVTGVCLAEIGHTVVCVDVNKKKLDEIRRGKMPIFEEGLSELMQKNINRINFSSDYREACLKTEMVIICVGTPEMPDGSADLSHVFHAAEQVSKSVNQNCILVVKSTVPIGTCDQLAEKIESWAGTDNKIDVVSNPEFLAQGTAVRDTLHASRIIIGVETEKASNAMKELYKKFEGIPLVVTNRKSAEMIKYASNDFLALKISYINEIANLCEGVGANIEDVAKGMGLDNRIGKYFLRAGIGYGGSCFPKDTKALHWIASNYQCELKTVKAAIEVNETQKKRLLLKLREYYADLRNKTIAVLGLTFKPGTDDVREAPALVVIAELLKEGAKVKAFDPIGIEKFQNAIAEKCLVAGEIEYYNNIATTLEDADACLILTEWAEITALTEQDFSKMKKAVVFDGRNCFPVEAMKHIQYESIGRQKNLDTREGL